MKIKKKLFVLLAAFAMVLMVPTAIFAEDATVKHVINIEITSEELIAGKTVGETVVTMIPTLDGAVISEAEMNNLGVVYEGIEWFDKDPNVYADLGLMGEDGKFESGIKYRMDVSYHIDYDFFDEDSYTLTITHNGQTTSEAGGLRSDHLYFGYNVWYHTISGSTVTPTEPVEPTTPTDTNTETTPTTTPTTEATKPAKKKSETPNTASSTNVLAYVVIGMISLVGACTLRNKYSK